MNPNQMIYFNALVLQHDFLDEARRSREGERTPDRPAASATAGRGSRGRGRNIFGLLHLALPGRR